MIASDLLKSKQGWMTNIIGPNGPNRCSRGSLGGEVPTFQGEKTNLEKGKHTLDTVGR